MSYKTAENKPCEYILREYAVIVVKVRIYKSPGKKNYSDFLMNLQQLIISNPHF